MSKRPPIIFIHGMWSTPAVWQLFESFFEQRGYDVHLPPLRHHETTSQNLELLGRTSIRDYVSDLSELVSGLEKKPILVGHSMGGLLALLLAGKGLAEKAVLLCPASPAGFLALQPSVVKTFSSVLSNWGFWKKPMKLSLGSADYGLFNGLPDEARVAHYQDLVFESGRAAAEIAFWPLDRHRSTRVVSSPSCPMLVMAGQQDRITPASGCYKIAARYGADYQQLYGHAHWLLSEPGWEKVAEQIEIWLSLDRS